MDVWYGFIDSLKHKNAVAHRVLQAVDPTTINGALSLTVLSEAERVVLLALAGELQRALGREFELRVQVQGDEAGGGDPHAGQVQPLHVEGTTDVPGATAAPKTGTVEIDAREQCEIARLMGGLKGPGSVYAAPVFYWLSGKVYSQNGWTNPFSYARIGKELDSDWRTIKKAVSLLVKGGLILEIGEPDEYARQRFRLRGYRYRSLHAAVAPTTCNDCTYYVQPLHPSESLDADDVKILKALSRVIQQHQQSESKGVQPLHPERATVAPGDVQPLHPDERTARRAAWLREFGVASDTKVTEIATAPLVGDGDLIGHMLDFAYQAALGEVEAEHMIGLFVRRVETGAVEPPARWLGEARALLAGGDVTGERLREALDAAAREAHFGEDVTR